MDECLRQRQRAAAGGDPRAERRLQHERCRAGDHCACSTPVGANVGIQYRRQGVEWSWGPISAPEDDETSTDYVEMVVRVDTGDHENNLHVAGLIAARIGAPPPADAEGSTRACPYCKAAKGERCVTKGGKPASRVHAARCTTPEGFGYVEDRRRQAGIIGIPLYTPDVFDPNVNYYEMR